MTAAASILAGMPIAAAMIRGVAPNAVLKAENQSSTSTTIANDEALLIPVTANSQWVWVAMIAYNGAAYSGSSGTVGGLFDAWNAPSGGSALWSEIGYGSGTALNLSMTANGAGAGSNGHNTNGTSKNLALVYLGSLIVGSTAGNLNYAWGQAVANATATSVVAGSWLAAWQVG